MTKNSLIQLEQKFGGKIKRVKREVFSEYDKNQEGGSGSHTGGDRMSSHRYAEHYANYFKKYLNKKINLVEVGILTGIGLSIWSEIFPQATIYGLDIDPRIYFNNQKNLIRLGAFQTKTPIVNSFDQFESAESNIEYLKKILVNGKVDVVIDDGCHMKKTAINTFESFRPYLSDNFTYVIEDQMVLWRHFRKAYPNFKVTGHGRLTIVRNKDIDNNSET